MSGRITHRQLFFIQIAATSPTLFLTLPGILFDQAGPDVLYAVVLASLAATVINVVVTTALAGHSPRRLFLEAFGPRLAVIPAACCGTCLYLAIMAEWQEYFTASHVVILPRTPEWAIGGAVTLAVSVLVAGGLDGMASIVDVILPASLFFIVLLLLVAIGCMHPVNELPLRPLHPSVIARSWWLPATFLGESVFAAPYVSAVRGCTAASVRRTLVAGEWVSTVLLFLAVAVTKGVFGLPYAEVWLAPVLEVIRMIRIGRFLTRLDVVFLPFWSGFVFTKFGLVTSGLINTVWPRTRSRTRAAVAIVVLGSSMVLSLTLFPANAARQAFLLLGWGDVAFPGLVILVVLVGLMVDLRPGARAPARAR